MLYDEQFKPVPGPDGSGFEIVGASEEYKLHVLQNLPVTKSGYLYVWVSNETNNINVFFDNLAVAHHTGPLLQEDDYYPFGLEMKMLGSRAAGKLENKFKYNGKELENDFGLEQYDFGARHYDAQIGRFNQIDPMPDHPNNINTSTYAYCINNPINLVDPDGMNWTMSSATDKDGNTTITFKFTGAVYQDKSSNNKYNRSQLNKLGGLIEDQITTTINGISGNVTFKAEADVRVINNEKKLGADEHLIRVTDGFEKYEDGRPDHGYYATSDLFGKELFLGPFAVNAILKGEDKNTAAHEAAHTGGLLHPNQNYFAADDLNQDSYMGRMYLGVWQYMTKQNDKLPGTNYKYGIVGKPDNLMISVGDGRQRSVISTQLVAMQNAIKWKLVNQNTINGKVRTF